MVTATASLKALNFASHSLPLQGGFVLVMSALSVCYGLSLSSKQAPEAAHSLPHYQDWGGGIGGVKAGKMKKLG